MLITLIIMDGWGYSPPWGGNAIMVAKTPNFDYLWQNYPHTTLQASGHFVGLPGSEMGNSEVGHLNLGAGRIILQDSSLINQSIKDNSFFTNLILDQNFTLAAKNNQKVHLIGLLSDGGVHSLIGHLFALLDLVKTKGVKSVYLHLFTDGRDSDPMSAQIYLNHLSKKLQSIKLGKIASVSGRYYAMDRDHRWERTQKAYQAMVEGQGQFSESPIKLVSESYAKGITDEFIIPTVINENGKPVAQIENKDLIVFFNFRSDRIRQIATAILAKEFEYFPRKTFDQLRAISMVPYVERELGLPLESVFQPKNIPHPLVEILSAKKIPQLHIAETEKYAHITYFFNAGHEKPYPGEKQILIPSPHVTSYDLKPDMSAELITQEVIKVMDQYQFILINYANPDMVGHTGNLKATIVACQTVDHQIQKIVEKVIRKKGIVLITADHGNAEEMINPVTGRANTEHSTNPVPFILAGLNQKVNLRPDGILADIAPTILSIMKIPQPPEMTGKNLILT